MHEEERIIGVRCAQRLAEEAIFRLEAALRPDMTEKQASACFRKICMEIPGVEKALTDMVISGPNSAGYHNFSSDRVLGTGSLILIDFSIIVNGWYSDMTRMFSFGDPEDEARRICGIVAAAKAQAIAAAYPGVAASHLHMTAASSLNAESQALLVPGSVFSIEPGIYLPGRFGARLEDLYYMSENGIVCLNQSEAVLKILPA